MLVVNTFCSCGCVFLRGGVNTTHSVWNMMNNLELMYWVISMIATLENNCGECFRSISLAVKGRSLVPKVKTQKSTVRGIVTGVFRLEGGAAPALLP